MRRSGTRTNQAAPPMDAARWQQIVSAWPQWQVGDRVRVPARQIGLTLTSRLGTVAGQAEWSGYWVIRLDEPARSVEPDDAGAEVPEIVEAGDNLQPLDAIEDTSRSPHRSGHVV